MNCDNVASADITAGENTGNIYNSINVSNNSIDMLAAKEIKYSWVIYVCSGDVHPLIMVF